MVPAHAGSVWWELRGLPGSEAFAFREKFYIWLTPAGAAHMATAPQQAYNIPDVGRDADTDAGRHTGGEGDGWWVPTKAEQHAIVG